MREYKFYDTDPMGLGWEEYDIVGDDYVDLIKTCCQYSKTLLLRISGEKINGISELERFRIFKSDNITFMPDHYYRITKCDKNPDEFRYFNICPELCDLLIHISNSIFHWIDGWGYCNPEDPTFYRGDGSVFFTSVIHDGVCTLTPREDECVDHIVEKEHWIKIN